MSNKDYILDGSIPERYKYPWMAKIIVYNNSQGGPVYREIPLFTGENQKPGSRGFPCIQVNGKFSIVN